MTHNDMTHTTALLERADPVELADRANEAARGRARENTAEIGQGPPCRARPGRRHSRGVLVFSDDAGPDTQAASGATASKVLRALNAPSGSILHIDFTGTSSYPDGRRWTWRQNVWSELSYPWQQLTVDERHTGTPAGTAATYNELYDPITNTVFAPPLPATPPQVKYIQQLRANLANGRASVNGTAMIGGRRTIRVIFRRSAEVDYVDRHTYLPVEIRGPSPDAGTDTYLFHTFEYLHAAARARLFNLIEAHPSARVDTSLSSYRAAYRRLFPDG